MLHEFLTRHRDEILRAVEEELRKRAPERPRENFPTMIPKFIDEIIKAERREAGLPEESTLPGETEEARSLGELRFEHGFRIRDIVNDYGSISQAIGDLAVEHGIELDARSYRVLNSCLDSGLAQAIDTYHQLSVERGEQAFAQHLGFLAHELRNSLSSAVLAYGFIRNGDVGMESRTAKILGRALNHLEALVSQTLVAVQLKSGVEPTLESLVLRDVVEEIHAAALPERSISVRISIPKQLTCTADPRLLGSALTNLLQNALKFTRSNGVVEIRGREEGGRVNIEVEDECGGLGGAEAELFEPFVQRGKKRRGVGLGLSITRDAIEAHRGTLTVRDLPGKGCVFTISLPQVSIQ
jgi:signal transduction histidine kinase